MVGQTISHYKILEKLGEGGMGIVYKAEDAKLDRLVALKFLPSRLTASEDDRLRFLHEAKAAATLNHPNVCIIYDIKEEEGQQFIVMEFVDGMTLRRKIAGSEAVRVNEAAKGGQSPMRVDDAIAYAIQIGDALQEAHSKEIVHRDIKSENIMVNSKNQIKVMDFGLAKLKGSMRLTKTSSTVGTLAYMAPEQIQGGEVDARSDIFSFGVVLFEMLTGKLPFRGEHDAAIMYSIVNEECDAVRNHREDASPELDRIIHRALEKDPADRYQHVDDMTSELRKLSRQSSRISRPQPVDEVSQRAQTGRVSQQQRVTAEVTPQRKGISRNVFVALLFVILAGIGGYIFLMPHAKTIDSLVVLPFVNASGNPDTEYLGDGMTESIINSLTQIPGLRVIPRSTAFRFKGKDVDPQEVGSKLGVRAVLTGRIVQRGDNLNLQLDLIDVDRQSQMYGNQYQRNASDIISMQEDVVKDVLKQLDVSVSKEDQKAVTKRYTDNVEAYKYYLQGRFHWQKRKASEILKAMEFFNQAIALDPSYALAYVGLADCYAIQEQYAGIPAREIAPKAIAAARQALALDNSLAEAHTTMAFAHALMWEWSDSEREFKTSIALNSQYPTAYHWYSILLFALGRDEEASNAIHRAHELDPLSPVIGVNIALAADREGKYERAIQLLDDVVSLDSSFSPAYVRKAQVFAKMGKLKEAYEASSKAVEISGRSAEALSFFGYCSGLIGKRDEALKIAKELEERYAMKTSSGYFIARVYLGLGDDTNVFRWLNVDFENHSATMFWLPQDREWDVYRSDPRFVDLMAKTGLKK